MPVEVLARRRPPFPLWALRESAEILLRTARAARSTLSILLTDDEEIRGLNRSWRGKDRATDVLSFPQDDKALLGDVAVSLDAARRQARSAGHTMFTEVTILLVHGILHLKGYDHERSAQDAAKMRRRERALLGAVGIDRDPLTSRP